MCVYMFKSVLHMAPHRCSPITAWTKKINQFIVCLKRPEMDLRQNVTLRSNWQLFYWDHWVSVGNVISTPKTFILSACDECCKPLARADITIFTKYHADTPLDCWWTTSVTSFQSSKCKRLQRWSLFYGELPCFGMQKQTVSYTCLLVVQKL